MKKNSYSFQKNIINVINAHKLIESGDGIVVAVSGGSDSIALLSVLNSLPLELHLKAVYVDHGLRPDETPEEIIHITRFCASLALTLIIKNVDVKYRSHQNKLSTEEAARDLRYEALEDVRRLYKLDKIAVGHNADDQVEEFFIRLFRGSGSSGLAGMRIQQGVIIRPLLFETKNSIEQYLRDNNISWSTDSSNFNRIFLRNRIRHDLLPTIEAEYNPGIRKTVLACMSVLRQEDDLLADICEHAYSHCVKEQLGNTPDRQSLSLYVQIDEYLLQHLAVRRRILEKICWRMAAKPSFITIGDIDKLARQKDNGKELHLSDGLRVIKRQNVLHFSHPPLQSNKRGTTPLPEVYTVVVDRLGDYTIPGLTMTVTLRKEKRDETPKRKRSDLHVDAEKLTFPLTIRGMHPGERFTPYKGAGSKKISRYFSDKKLEKSKRSSWPILLCGNTVVAIIGYTVEHQFRVTEATTRVLCISDEVYTQSPQ